MTTEPANGLHFGEKLRANRKYGHHCNRETFAYPSRSPHVRFSREHYTEARWKTQSWMFHDEEQRYLSDKLLLVQRDRAMVNFDISMQYFQSLDATEFDTNIEKMLCDNPGFTAVKNLPDYESIAGVYVMVFDKYKQLYIGKADNIRKRIKDHWSAKKALDRVIFGNSEYESIFPVDELRRLDTTRIYAMPTDIPFDVEQGVVDSVDRKFSLNRIGGGDYGPLLMLQHTADPRQHQFAYEIQEIDQARKIKNIEFVESLLERNRVASTSPIADLALLPRTIYRVTSENGTTHLWTLRMLIRALFIQDKLTQDEFIEYLKALGESPILLDN